MRFAPALAGVLALVAAAPAGAAVKLAPCPDSPAARCGTIVVPAVRSDLSAGTMRIAFRRYPALAGPAKRTLLAIEGGPGYPTVGSAGYYLAMLGPARRTTALVLVDQRGTGESELIDCPVLQDFPYAPFAPVALRPYRLAVGRCGDSLGSRSDAFGTGAAVDDMVAVLDALRLRRVDVYGDSYGSYAAQTLALRHPGRVRSLVLDGTYPLDYDPWARDALAVLRSALRATCDRSPTCPWQTLDPVERVATLARSLRAHPLKVVSRDAGGEVVRVRLDDRGLAGVLAGADGDLAIYRDFPAAEAAYNRGDGVPLARLAAEAFAGGANGPAQYYSAGLDAAVECHDYPQLFSASASPGERFAQIAAGLARLRADAFSPFDKPTWFGADLESYDWCVNWPRPAHAPDPGRRPGTPYPAVPTLILGGDLDQRTSLIGARRVAAQFPDSTLVPVANTGHVTALVDWMGCAAGIVRRFVATRRVSGIECAAQTPPLHLVTAFPRSSATAPEAAPAESDESWRPDRRRAWCAAQAVSDAIARYGLVPGTRGTGLRGGHFTVLRGLYLTSHPVTLRLHGVRFCRDVAVSGKVVWHRRSGRVRAAIAYLTTHASLTWSLATLAPASLRGHTTVSGQGPRALRLTLPAP
ncbi:MAG TPA: alpha/beta fold hydrolase [Gaiellales bacterium]|nr:alpha/beta fold hydrolase [Gaiellales bacterium]